MRRNDGQYGSQWWRPTNGMGMGATECRRHRVNSGGQWGVLMDKASQSKKERTLRLSADVGDQVSGGRGQG